MLASEERDWKDQYKKVWKKIKKMGKNNEEKVAILEEHNLKSLQPSFEI